MSYTLVVLHVYLKCNGFSYSTNENTFCSYEWKITVFYIFYIIKGWILISLYMHTQIYIDTHSNYGGMKFKQFLT